LCFGVPVALGAQVIEVIARVADKIGGIFIQAGGGAYNIFRGERARGGCTGLVQRLGDGAAQAPDGAGSLVDGLLEAVACITQPGRRLCVLLVLLYAALVGLTKCLGGTLGCTAAEP